MAINSPLNYTSTTRIKQYLNSRTPLSDQQINDIAEKCEQFVDMLTKTNNDISFSAAKHAIMRETAELRAALLVMMAEPLSMTTLNEVGIRADVIYDAYIANVKLLQENQSRDFMRGV